MDPFSEPDGLPSYITFWNRSLRRAAIYWYDYSGKLVRYGVLSPDERLSLDTYSTHPWCCRDDETWDELVVNKRKEFYPKAWDGSDTREVITIDIPVYSLLERCKQIVRLAIRAPDIFDLEIPYHLKFELHHIEKYDFTLYQSVTT
ncbi:hypothetical protein FSP39_008395 [Pinctada imbricata]|uniref:von Hippel-Lindau disease tumour suppressor beta domain-containing protein n=1 Tax=Pinctada imbricata TaxID=66713 RepID=A0AA88YQE7_PINIB|nr:hypothetical protein FSP39_008395 [Pinctada imbricata]